ncbi:MAG: amidohydrolase family protein [Gammaproteobacteria bacterium]|nr:amidohydrolase family protein [Gammaproteobacteria bacterium]MDH4254873.1 amidohydrolase family protein [Gammaproteobacteria bacterium]MDH5310596.1 amidohydrolase family protein [Gammaproteobacteria bacterium]
MRRQIFPLIACLACATAAAQQDLRPEGPVAFVNGMLLDGYEAEPIHRAVVVVDDGRIVAAGPAHSTPVPAGAQLVDIGGKTILPGLIDAHVHVDLIGHGDYDRYYRFLRGTERLAEVMPIAAKQMLRAGVTSAIDLGTPFDILALRERIERGEIPGPRLTISGPWITRIYLEGVPDSYQVMIDSPREAAARTRELIAQGSDVVKLWAGLTPEDYKAAVAEAHRLGVKVHAHLYHPDAIRYALDAGVDVLQHVGSARNPPYPDDLVARIAHDHVPVVQTIAHRIWVYPATVAFPERLLDPVHRKDMPPDIYAEVIDSFENFHRLPYFHDIGPETRHSKLAARQFIDAGAVMGVGTDAASPLNFHTEAMWYEMKALVESGMTPIQVISAATKTNAEILGRFKELGTVEPGKLADLVVVDGNPLAHIDALADVEIVVRDGVVWYAESAASGPVVAIGHAF